MLKISIVIVNWNTRAMLKQCLESVFQQTTASFEIFVVDNASGDGSGEMVLHDFPAVRLIQNPDNRGFAAANNQALRLASGEYILLLNPDTIILDNAIDRMLVYMDQAPDVGAASCKLLNGDLTLQKSVGNFYSFWATLLENRLIPKLVPNNQFLAKKYVAFWDHTTRREIDWARGAVLLVRQQVLQQIGLLDEQFYIYGEEIDWCWRIKQAGWKIMVLPEAEIIHFGKAASSQRHTEMFIQNYKSFYILLKKHYPVYSYWLYRLRTMIYLFVWLLWYAVLAARYSKKSPQHATATIGLKLYTTSWKWHFSKKSLIKLRTKQ